MQLHYNTLDEHAMIEKKRWQLFGLESRGAYMRGEVGNSWHDIKVGGEWAGW